MRNIDILGACSDLGVNINGANLGPEYLIQKMDKSLIHQIKTIKSDLNFQKELDKNNKKKNLDEINQYNEKLYIEVKNTFENNCFPITLGGDHSIAIGSALASIKKYNNLGIIWFDAHGDFNTFETTTSGNIHGLPFAAITGYEKKLLTEFHNGNYFNFKNAVLVGASDIDEPYELQNLRDAGVTIFTAEDIKKYGADTIYSKAFDIASNETNGIHISYDIDVIDPSIAPGVSIPTINGISLEDAYTFKDYIIKNKEKIKSIDLVELNPLNDINNQTEKIVLHILNELIKKI